MTSSNSGDNKKKSPESERMENIKLLENSSVIFNLLILDFEDTAVMVLPRETNNVDVEVYRQLKVKILSPNIARLFERRVYKYIFINFRGV